MLKAKNLVLGLMVAGSLSTAAAALAQSTAPVPAPVAAPKAPPAQIDIRVPQRSNLTAKEMTDGASDFRKRMEAVAFHIDTLLKEATDQKDIIRINCLNDKSLQVKSSLGVADKSMVALQDALAKSDKGASLHEYTRITIVNQNVQVLAGEAESCVGEELSYVGQPRVDVELPPGPDPNEAEPTPESPDRPPAVSPFI